MMLLRYAIERRCQQHAADTRRYAFYGCRFHEYSICRRRAAVQPLRLI